ncbi:MAG: VanZ family protein [Firmicutes bacterium]|nr:VanZ family protein [Bacillota bacterium]
MNKIISWAAVIIWMVLIFNLSSQVAEQSNQLSTGITEAIVKTIEKIAPNVEFDISGFNHIVRKNAHFFAYLVLGILVLNAFRRNEIYGYKNVILAIIVCILYAASDETHQLFVPGRGGQVRDVIIDSTGAGVGIVINLVFTRIVKRKIA